MEVVKPLCFREVTVLPLNYVCTLAAIYSGTAAEQYSGHWDTSSQSNRGLLDQEAGLGVTIESCAILYLYCSIFPCEF